MTADPCLLGVTAVSLFLQLLEVVVDPIQAVVDRLLVLRIYLQRNPDGETCHFPRPGWTLPQHAPTT
jgi:peptide-methionine (S)-S-oxide reductase